MVVGNPARVARLRFEPAVVAALLELAWWDWDAAEILAHRGAITGDVHALLALGRSLREEGQRGSGSVSGSGSGSVQRQW